MSDTDWVMYRGDDRSWLVTPSGIDDVSGANVRFTAKRRVGDDDADAVISLVTPDEVQIASSTSIRVNIPASATAELERETKLYWDLQVEIEGEVRTLPDADVRRSTLGTLTIRRDVTRTSP